MYLQCRANLYPPKNNLKKNTKNRKAQFFLHTDVMNAQNLCQKQTKMKRQEYIAAAAWAVKAAINMG